jgi:8-oxo-dGTP diphosphatase
VLLVQRGASFGKGLWSLPGGKVEPGETDVAAAAREVLEETCVVAKLLHPVDTYVIDAGSFCYSITCFAGFYLSGEAKAASDAAAVTWVQPSQLAAFKLAPNTAAAIGLANKLISL